MSQARLLNQQDIDQFKNLINRKFHAKEIKAPDSNQKFLDALERSGQSNTRVYGYFDSDGNLLSASCQYLWQRLPFYTMTWGLIHPRFSNVPFNVSVKESGARESFDVAVRYAESIGRYTFYYGMTLRNLKTRRDIWLQQDSYLTTNYERNIETIVKAGEEPEYEPWKQIIGFQPRKQDIVIKVCRKKPELFHKELYDKKLIDVDYDTLYNKK
jgi:hypothetical protein